MADRAPAQSQASRRSKVGRAAQARRLDVVTREGPMTSGQTNAERMNEERMNAGACS